MYNMLHFMYDVARPCFVDACVQNWETVHAISRRRIAPNICSVKGDACELACGPNTCIQFQFGDLGNLFEFWEISTVLLNFGIKKRISGPKSFLGFKNVRHLPCGFEFSRF